MNEYLEGCTRHLLDKWCDVLCLLTVLALSRAAHSVSMSIKSLAITNTHEYLCNRDNRGRIGYGR